MQHPVIWLEMSAQDSQATAQWYADLFDWRVRVDAQMGYGVFDSAENGPSGGFVRANPQYPAGTVTFYIQTDNVADHLRRIEAKGGQTLLPATPVPGVGTIGLFRDPTGNVLGLMTPIPR